MVLCAGFGTRLRPLTTQWPKPALPLLGRPLLAYHLAAFKAAGVGQIGINSHHLPEVMESCAAEESSRLGLSLTSVREMEIQGTGGGIRGLRSFLQDDVFVVWNGDNLFDLDLGPVVKAHRESKAAATMVLLPMPKNEAYGAVELDGTGAVRRIAGCGPGGEDLVPWHFSGVHVLSPTVFDFMGSGPEDINKDVYPRMMKAGLRIHGHCVSNGFWSDLGTPARYLETQCRLLTRTAPLSIWESLLPKPGKACIDSSAQVHPEARIEKTVYVGPHARIGAKAILDRACVLEGTEVAHGEVVRDAIAWKGKEGGRLLLKK